MSQENVEQLRRGIDDFNRRDLDAYLAGMDDEAEYVPRVGSMEGSYHGRDGIRRFWEHLLGVWPDLSVQIRQVRDFGDLDAVLVPLWVGGMVWLAIVGKWTAFIIIALAVPAALALDIFWLSPRLTKRQRQRQL